MYVSMIYYTSNQGNRQKTESVLADSVRTLIITNLKDGIEKKFSEITIAVAKKDNVINRELKMLVAVGWVIKTGVRFSSRYRLDISREDVRDYIKHAEMAIPGNSEISEIKIDLNVPYKDIKSNAPNYIASVLPIKEAIANHILKYIKISVIGEKIEDYDPNKRKEATLTGEEFVEIAHIINRIISKRSWHNLRIEVRNDPELEDDKVEFYSKTCNDLRVKTWKKPLKIIISYTPDPANEDDLVALAKMG